MGIVNKIRARFGPVRKPAEVFELALFQPDDPDSRFVRVLRPTRVISSASTALPADAPATGSKLSITNKILRTVGGVLRKGGQVVFFLGEAIEKNPNAALFGTMVQSKDATEPTLGLLGAVAPWVIMLFAFALDDEDWKQVRDCKECKKCQEDRSDIGPLGLGAAPFG
jgi:hypothetical protein